MFSKKKSDSKDKGKAKDKPEVKVALDTLEMESVADQLREIEEKKKKKPQEKS